MGAPGRAAFEHMAQHQRIPAGSPPPYLASLLGKASELAFKKLPWADMVPLGEKRHIIQVRNNGGHAHRIQASNDVLIGLPGRFPEVGLLQEHNANHQLDRKIMEQLEGIRVTRE